MITFYAVSNIDADIEDEVLFSNEAAAKHAVLIWINLDRKDDEAPELSLDDIEWREIRPSVDASDGQHFACYPTDEYRYYYYREVTVYESTQEWFEAEGAATK